MWCLRNRTKIWIIIIDSQLGDVTLPSGVVIVQYNLTQLSTMHMFGRFVS